MCAGKIGGRITSWNTPARIKELLRQVSELTVDLKEAEALLIEQQLLLEDYRKEREYVTE